MKTFENIDQVLDFAIEQEQMACEFYSELASKVESQAAKKVFSDFAREEAQHKQKLMEIKRNHSEIHPVGSISDLKIADSTNDVAPAPDMNLQEAYILAMKNEKAAFKLYSSLAAATENPQIKETLLSLAQEEAKHKLQFEIDYEAHFMAEN